MPSPFPGMDPYLEHPAHWADFHSRFVNYWCEAVADALPDHYTARIWERVYLDTSIEILHRPDRSLVAVLELLSPANKQEPGRGDYLAKRNAILRQKIHLVELDLLLGGQRLPLRLPLPPADYYAFSAHADRRPDCDVYSWTLPEPLPPLPIPLRTPDPDVWVDIGAVLTTAYDRGRFAREIDYSQPPPVPVSDERQQWIAACLQKTGTGG